MTRAELIQQLSTRFPQLTATDVDLAVRVILDGMSRTLVRGGRIEVRGFGGFGINYRPPRKGRNPKTGASVMVPAKYTPHFKAGKELRDRVDSVTAIRVVHATTIAL
jgi:integration host factor subunit beta